MNNSAIFKPTNFHHALIFTQGIKEYTLLDALKKKPISIQVNSILSIQRLSTSKTCYVVRFQGKLINEF